MSLRIDSTEWITGALVIGGAGLGVPAEDIPSGAYCANDLDLPADNGKEICGRITRWPTNGTLTAWEDTSFTYSGGSDSFDYQLYVDGVATGAEATVTLSMGGAAGATLTGAGAISAGAAQADSAAPGATLTGSGTLSRGATTADSTAPGATLTGTGAISAGSAFGQDATAPGATLTGTGTIVAGAASDGTVGNATAPGATLTGMGDLMAGDAVAAAEHGAAAPRKVTERRPGTDRQRRPVIAGASRPRQLH